MKSGSGTVSQARLTHLAATEPKPVREVRAMAEVCQEAMTPHQKAGLVSLQPREFLHYTVQLIDRHRSEVTDDQLTALIIALDRISASGPLSPKPLELTLSRSSNMTRSRICRSGTAGPEVTTIH